MKRRSGLGRGLDALLPTGPEEDRAAAGSQRSAPVEAIDPNPDQPREEFGEGSLQELADSISQLGILQPLLVREVGGRLQLIAGERRLRAAKDAGLSEVPVMLVETDERGSLERALVENIHRENLNPIEEAAAYRQLIEDGGLTQEEMAARIGKNRVTVSNTLRLLDLPVPVQRYLIEGKITAGHGRALLGLQGNPFQERLARRAAAEQLSVRETEDMVRKYQAMTEGATGRGKLPRPAEVGEAQRRLADYLQTRVRVDLGKRKGKIVMDFVSLEELDRLTGLITGSQEPRPPTTVRPE